MRLRCPNCRERLDSVTLACENNHRFVEEDGVLVLLEEKFGRQLQTFLTALQATRRVEGKHLLESSAYKMLPFNQDNHQNRAWRLEWRLRRYDLTVIRQWLGNRTGQRILDVGAWNGWLSHRLAEQGHQVVAVDFFIDEFDGLRAKKFYPTTWQAIQMDLRNLSIIDQHFDVAILNRCLQFFPDPEAYLANLKKLVEPGGFLMLIGLQFFQQAGAKAQSVASQQYAYRERYQADLFLFPSKGYLDWRDKERLQTQGLVLRPYPQLWLANIKSMLWKTLPRHYYGVYCRPELKKDDNAKLDNSGLPTR